MGSVVFAQCTRVTTEDRQTTGRETTELFWYRARPIWSAPKNRPITDKVIVRNPGYTLLSDTVLFFGMATHFWPLTVCLSRLVYRVCTRQPWTYRCVFRWHMKQPFKWAHAEVSFMVLLSESKKARHQTLSHNFTNYYPIFNFFTSGLGSKFATNSRLNIPSRFKHVARLYFVKYECQKMASFWNTYCN